MANTADDLPPRLDQDEPSGISPYPRTAIRVGSLGWSERWPCVYLPYLSGALVFGLALVSGHLSQDRLIFGIPFYTVALSAFVLYLGAGLITLMNLVYLVAYAMKTDSIRPLMAIHAVLSMFVTVVSTPLWLFIFIGD